jgi:hypothetical protein
MYNKIILINLACDAGFYGRSCKKKFSKNCDGGNRNCDPTTGHCKLSCKPGWINHSVPEVNSIYK